MEINNLLNSEPIEPALLEAWKASPLLAFDGPQVRFPGPNIPIRMTV
jgi:hypothetical protein